MKRSIKKLMAMCLVFLLTISALGVTALAAGGIKYKSPDPRFTIEKISHPTSG